MKNTKGVPAFNDHGSSCKGHANHMLDCTMEKQEDRDNMITVIDNYLPEEDRE